ncbi:MAG: trypsin-like peptidase domain-containing protein [Alistipes sp.]|nr:trypsin-like peptidase domain-containing protein [Alistipes sp.]
MFENDENNFFDSTVTEESNDVQNDIQSGIQNEGKEEVRRETPVFETEAEHAAQQPEKKQGWFGRSLKFVAMAAVFGLVAGCVFYGINYAADKAMGTNVVIPKETEMETTGITVNRSETTAPVVSQMANAAVMDVSRIVEKNMPSAVAITGSTTVSYSFNPFFPSTYETPISGSGVIIGQNATELLIVSNAHVVEDVNDLTVTFIDGSTAGAVLKGSKTNKDIAVIAVKLSDLSQETLSSIAIVEIGDSDTLKMGQPVIAIGNALGEGQSSNVGWISALNRTITIESTEYENLIMTDAAINPGNSGGALLNMDGQLVGITSAKYSDEKVEGMGYAIPISSVEDIINDLMNRQIRTKVDEDKIGYLGINGLDVTKDISRSYNWPEGVLVTIIGEGTPAQKAGLLKNDIIYGFDGEDVTSIEQLHDLMEYYEAGETVVVEFYRLTDGEFVENSMEVTLGNRSQQQ